MQIKTILAYPEKLPKPLLTFIGFLLVLAIGSLDSVTSYDVSVSFLYLFPIILIAWYEGGLTAAILSIFSTLIWSTSDLASGHLYSNFAIPLWNALMVLSTFLIVAYSITLIRKLLLKEREHAHTDDLTGASNISFFYEQARAEIGRLAVNERALTLACITIDNLRYLNDTIGHMAGDYLLHEASQIMRSSVRPTDIVSRLGGAQFAILMPETNNENAGTIIYKVQQHLLDMAKKQGWPATFSTGVVTCDDPACALSQLIKTAEDLTKAAQEAGQNLVRFKIMDPSSTAS
jgi:diguanylate cyclase (GGDEF)-like protein